MIEGLRGEGVEQAVADFSIAGAGESSTFGRIRGGGGDNQPGFLSVGEADAVLGGNGLLAGTGDETHGGAVLHAVLTGLAAIEGAGQQKGFAVGGDGGPSILENTDIISAHVHHRLDGDGHPLL